MRSKIRRSVWDWHKARGSTYHASRDVASETNQSILNCENHAERDWYYKITASLKYEGRGESLESFAKLPTPIANRFGRATQWRGLVVFCLRLA